jgi:hypothetical protein
LKVVAKSIEMIAWFTKDGTPNPIRFKIEGEDESVSVIKVDKIIEKDKERLAGNPMMVFKCQSLIDGIEKIYEIKYEVNTCKWILYKM